MKNGKLDFNAVIYYFFFFPTKEVTFLLLVFVCLSVSWITQKVMSRFYDYAQWLALFYFEKHFVAW